jgi:hypothetical protein
MVGWGRRDYEVGCAVFACWMGFYIVLIAALAALGMLRKDNKLTTCCGHGRR